jgi:hypothetical protein
MEFVFTLFGLAAEGVMGSRWKRWAATCVGLVVAGVGLKLGAADWLFDRYLEFQTAAAERLLQDVLDQINLPSTAAD